MVNSLDSTKVLKAIGKLQNIEQPGLLRRFVHFRGLSILLKCLENHIESKDFVRYNILNALKIIPVSTKNAVQALEPTIETLTSVEYGEDTSRVAKELLESWKDLEIVYRIPKRDAKDLVPEPKRQKVEENFGENMKREGSVALSDSSGHYITRKLSPAHSLKRTWSFATKMREVSPSPNDLPSETVSEAPSSKVSITDVIEAARLATEKREAEAAKLAKKLEHQAKKKEKEDKLNFQKLKEKQKRAAVMRKSSNKALSSDDKPVTETVKSEEKKAIVNIKELSSEERQRIKTDVIGCLIQVSKIVIKQMSRCKDQIEPQDFKEKAKLVIYCLIHRLQRL